MKRHIRLMTGFLVMAAMVCVSLHGIYSAPGKDSPRLAPGPVTVEVKSPDGKAIGGVAVHLGGRFANTDANGTAVLDGVPEGAFKMLIVQNGYDRLEQTVELPAGKRKPLDVKLSPAVVIPVQGVVTLEGDARPLAGAGVAMAPLEVAAAIKGPYSLLTGWDGKFSILEVPAGKYRVELKALGCADKTFETEVKPGGKPFEWSMVRVSEPAGLKVVARDSLSNQALAGAKVVLAEAWPKGVIATSVTDAEGAAIFKDLKVGRLNWMDANDNLAVCRRQVTLHVEAADHESTTWPAVIGESAATVLMNPTAKVTENGACTALASAQSILTGAPVEFKINKIGKNCFFKFRLKYPAFVRMKVGPKNPMHVQAALMDAGGKVLGDRISDPGVENVMEYNLAAGEYHLRVGHWGNSAQSDQAMALVVNQETAADPFEPNNSKEQARIIRSGEEVRGCIFPVGDVDFFRFEMSRPGQVRFTMRSHPIHRQVIICDEKGRPLADRVCDPSHPLELICQLAPGRYLVQVRQWGDSQASLTPYTLKIETVGDDDVDDPPDQAGRLAAVRSIGINQLVGSTIFPVGDIDKYSISVPTAGVLHARMIQPIHSLLRMRNAQGQVLSECVSDPGRGAEVAFHFDGPQTVFLETRQWGDSACSVSPYILSAWWEPCDEQDAVGRNDTLESAWPLELGDWMRGTILPVRDVDVYRVEVDHPGYLHVKGSMPAIHSQVRIFDGKKKLVAERVTDPRAINELVPAVLPGVYFIELRQWGDSAASSIPYAFQAWLERADPLERVPLNNDSPRRLKLGEAQPLVIEQVGDVDRFIVETAAAGKTTLRWRMPIHSQFVILDDRNGNRIADGVRDPGVDCRVDLDANGPARYRAELRHWGDSGATMEPGYILADMQPRDIVAERLEVSVDPYDPTLVTFARKEHKPYAGGGKLTVDPDGRGKDAVEVPAGGSATWRYRSEGLYTAVGRLAGANGTSTLLRAWVQAVGMQDRKGVRAVVNFPGEGQVVDRDEACRVMAVSYSGARIAKVQASVDGRAAGIAYTSPYVIDVPWGALGAGNHVLTVSAVDARGDSTTVTRNFGVSDYFELLPADGSVVTGNAVRVSWQGAFGPARVRYRAQGQAEWKEAVGESARNRSILLADVEPGKAYEFQPVGGKEPGPVRTVTRVKGLAFGKAKYAGTIQRDYDQRLGVSVRNHADKPITLKLECGKLPEESKLLAGFVGEGSEGAPVNLAPGEEREFMLGLSAQDVIAPTHRFPIRIAAVSGEGYADEAEVEVNVKLPNVALEWEEKGEIPGGIGKVMLLKNKGDSLTDLSLRSSSSDMSVTPSTDHGLFPAGATMEVRLTPRLYEGFQSVTGKVTAKAVDKAVDAEQKVALKEGQKIYAVDIGPKAEDAATDEVQKERSLAGAFMNPNAVDWSRKTNPQDTDGDGKIDTWTVDIPEESTRWVGRDTDGDGEIDFVQAYIGTDGRAYFSAVRGPKGWEETNLVDSHLEMGFKLPWARSAYEKHDADIVMNDKVVGKLRDTIPEGSYRFQVSPLAFKFNEDGSPAGNRVEIRSKHLRGGHYVVSSDFRMKLALTGTRVYNAAVSREQADKAVRSTPGLVLDAPDLSISSQELRLQGEPKSGSPITLTVPVWNLGAVPARRVEIALRFNAGGEDVELTRTALAEIPAGGTPTMVELNALAPAGDVSLKVVIDPDKKLADPDRDNNEAIIPFKASGDTVKPVVTIESPAANAALNDPAVQVSASATDNVAIARVDLRVDKGLWVRLGASARGYEGKTLLQPGAHVLTLRAMDTSGNIDEKSVNVTVNTPSPKVEIVEPAQGASIEARGANIVAACGEDVARIAARVNGGPWRQGTVKDGRATIPLKLAFGNDALEVMAVNKQGVRTTVARQVNCTAQADANAAQTDANAAASAPTGSAEDVQSTPLDVPGVGKIDPFGTNESPVVTNATPGTSDGGKQAPAGGSGTSRPADDAPIAPADKSAEKAPVPDMPGDDGNYGAEPPSGADPAALAGLDEEENAPDSDDENMDPDQWLNDPNADTAEDPELADPPAPDDLDYQPPDMESWDDMPAADSPSAAKEDNGDLGGAGGFSPLPPLGENGGGGYVGVQQKQSDWYCTNRPTVGVNFQMPDWLKKLNLPKPGTKEFEAAFQKRLAALKAKGIDTSKLEALRTILRNHCNRLDSPEELPTFLQSLGLAKPNTNDPAKLKEWRDAMANATDAFMLRLLHSNDPALIAAGLKARSAALGQFDKASQEAANAAVETIAANQKITEDVASVIPYVNIAISAHALWSGETLGGEKLGKLDMVLHTLTLAGPAMGLLKNPTLRQAAASIGGKAMWLGENTIGKLAAKMGVTGARLRGAMTAVSEALGNARIAAGEKLFGKVWAAEQRFLNSPAGRKAMELARQDIQQAESLLHRIAQARAGGDKETYRRLIASLQGNKTAQGLLNSAKYSNEFRSALDKTHRAMARLADKRTIAEVMKNPKVQQQIEALAKKFGVKAEDIVIRARNVSGNTKTLASLKPGEMLKYGADRDVVYQFVTKEGKTLSDVHHKLVEKVYAQNLRRITGRSLSEMDHVVTSRWHPEAYNGGLNPNTKAGQQAITDIISGKSAGKLRRASDVRDTVVHKGKEWIEAGEKCAERGRVIQGNQKIREGMRQMTKEYNRQVAQFLKAKGLDPAKALPPRLRQGMEIFQKVQQGATVEQAREMLKALTPKGGVPVTPQTIVEDLGAFVEFVNKWGIPAAP